MNAYTREQMNRLRQTLDELEREGAELEIGFDYVSWGFGSLRNNLCPERIEPDEQVNWERDGF